MGWCHWHHVDKMHSASFVLETILPFHFFGPPQVLGEIVGLKILGLNLWPEIFVTHSNLIFSEANLPFHSAILMATLSCYPHTIVARMGHLPSGPTDKNEE